MSSPTDSPIDVRHLAEIVSFDRLLVLSAVLFFSKYSYNTSLSSNWLTIGNTAENGSGGGENREKNPAQTKKQITLTGTTPNKAVQMQWWGTAAPLKLDAFYSIRQISAGRKKT